MLTIAYITGRHRPRLDWFFESLDRQMTDTELYSTNIILVMAPCCEEKPPKRVNVTVTQPKPCVWQGPHRLTSCDWWAMSSARNTAICLAQDGYIVFVDDRCILGPEWMQSVRDEIKGNYAVAGTYTKYHGLKPDGTYDKVDGKDHRLNFSKGGPCDGGWFFGCSCGLPLEWALNVNGYDEDSDSLGFEDCIFGVMLEKNGYPIRFDPRMSVSQDRTPGECGPVYRKTDKGVSPNDKSHAIINMVQTGGRNKAPNYFGPEGIRGLRQRVLAGEPFPINQTPQHDWFDGTPISEMK